MRAVVAVGASVLFIEFGAGVTYPDNHPQAAELGMKRGEYGKGHGKQSSWGYYGDPGTNGVVKTKKDGSTVVITTATRRICRCTKPSKSWKLCCLSW